MSSYNKVILMGRLTRKPELSYSNNGRAFCPFSVAVNERYKNKDGEQVETVSFVDVKSYGRSAETLAQFLDKGEPLHLEGRLRQDKWTTAEGEARQKTVVVLDRFQFLPSRGPREAAAA